MNPVTNEELKAIRAMIAADRPLPASLALELVFELCQLREQRKELSDQLAEALKGRLLVPLVNVERDLCRMSTWVTVELPYAEFDECRDREQFRSSLALKLNSLGDAFLSAWDERHGDAT